MLGVRTYYRSVKQTRPDFVKLFVFKEEINSEHNFCLLKNNLTHYYVLFEDLKIHFASKLVSE